MDSFLLQRSIVQCVPQKSEASLQSSMYRCGRRQQETAELQVKTGLQCYQKIKWMQVFLQMHTTANLWMYWKRHTQFLKVINWLTAPQWNTNDRNFTAKFLQIRCSRNTFLLYFTIKMNRGLQGALCLSYSARTTRVSSSTPFYIRTHRLLFFSQPLQFSQSVINDQSDSMRFFCRYINWEADEIKSSDQL